MNDWDDSTPIEEYSLFGGEMAHPKDLQDDLRAFHDDFMIDLQPSKDAAHNDRLQQEARAAARKRAHMRARMGA